MRKKKLVISYGLLFLMLCTGLIGIGSLYRQVNSIISLKVGNYEINEGIVRNFKPLSENYGKTESFEINNQEYSYGKGILTGGLDTELQSKGLKNGVRARIFIKNYAIIRVDIIY